MSRARTIADFGDGIATADIDDGAVTTAKIASSTLVGTVSESSGTPTGAIIERGSNANGGFVKYADGTMICYGEITAPNNTGLGAKTQDWTFPSSFVDANRKVFCNFRFNNPANMDRCRYLHPSNDATVTNSAQTIGWHEGAWTVNNFGTEQPIMLQAIGRWF